MAATRTASPAGKNPTATGLRGKGEGGKVKGEEWPSARRGMKRRIGESAKGEEECL
jgi:hypothetical protein